MSSNKISSFAFVSPSAILGKGNVVMENVIIRDNVRIGNNNTFYPGCVIGEVGEYIDKVGKNKIIIGDNNTLREHVVVQGSILKAFTMIDEYCYIMHGSHVAHDCHLFNNVIIAPLTSLGGNVCIRSYANIGQGVIIHPNLTIGESAMLGCNATVVKDVPDYETWASPPPSRKIGYNIRGLAKRGFSKSQIDSMIQGEAITITDCGAVDHPTTID